MKAAYVFEHMVGELRETNQRFSGHIGIFGKFFNGDWEIYHVTVINSGDDKLLILDHKNEIMEDFDYTHLIPKIKLEVEKYLRQYAEHIGERLEENHNRWQETVETLERFRQYHLSLC